MRPPKEKKLQSSRQEFFNFTKQLLTQSIFQGILVGLMQIVLHFTKTGFISTYQWNTFEN